MSYDPQTRAERLTAMKGQIAYFYGNACGYFPIDAGIRDDDASTGIQVLIPTEERPDIPNARTWHYYDPERPDLLDAAAETALQKADTYGNVYLTRTLSERKCATKDSAKASRIIAIEAHQLLATAGQLCTSHLATVAPVIRRLTEAMLSQTLSPST